MGNRKGFIPWNKGKSGIYTEETKRRIGIAASKRNKGRKFTRLHRKHLSIARAALKICSQCSIKSKWIYGVCIPSITSYTLWLCDDCLLDQYYSMKKVEVVS